MVIKNKKSKKKAFKKIKKKKTAKKSKEKTFNKEALKKKRKIRTEIYNHDPGEPNPRDPY